MNKKITIFAIIVLILIAGLSYWYWQTSVAAPSAKAPADDRPLIEIFYLPHAPALAVVDKVEPIIARFPQYTVKKYDFLDDASQPKIREYNLFEHTPIAIFIDGINTFTVDGKSISLSNFPKGEDFVPTYEGEWSYDDLEKILASR